MALSTATGAAGRYSSALDVQRYLKEDFTRAAECPPGALAALSLGRARESRQMWAFDTR